MPRTKLQL